MKKIITIFGSSKPANNEEQYLTAYNLGKKLALNGFDICTGGFNGIMEAASKGAVEGGGEIPHEINFLFQVPFGYLLGFPGQMPQIGMERL